MKKFRIVSKGPRYRIEEKLGWLGPWYPVGLIAYMDLEDARNAVKAFEEAAKPWVVVE